MLINDLINNFSNNTLIDYLYYKIPNIELDNQIYQTSTDDSLYQHFPEYLYLANYKTNCNKKFGIFVIESSGQLNEKSQKKNQYLAAKELLNRHYLSYGFFFFYDSNKAFRVSLVIKYDENISNKFYKRYTFYVNPNKNNKTFATYFDKIDFLNFQSILDGFSVESVTKDFYRELVNWYSDALSIIKFAPDVEKNNEREIALIRFITRIMFVWFMKEKNLIPDILFDAKQISKYFNSFDINDTNYYLAVLQNLFFATLNTKIEDRQFRVEKDFYINEHYMKHNFFRHQKLIKDELEEELFDIFRKIPFLNGGLFECLDWKDDETGTEYRYDGFSDVESKQPKFPNFLFFGNDDKNHYFKGLFEIFKSYNFTIDENTIDDQDVALDPELLGNVFENLLATYNPETKESARKSTGSFYTSREIVNYMVEKSLIEYFKAHLTDVTSPLYKRFNDVAKTIKVSEGFDSIYTFLDNIFKLQDKPVIDKNLANIFLDMIDNIRVLDPAVGSGAFMMTMLHKLSYLLNLFDPNNQHWKQKQIDAIQQSNLDEEFKAKYLNELQKAFEENDLDYARKLYLIRKCLFGVDIQPIAIQIAKLRFFISLLVDQKIDKKNPHHLMQLPNLETKLIAADTLTPLKVSDEQISLGSNLVLDKENEIFKLRQKYFNAHDVKDKEKLRKLDKKLRKELLELMKSSGFDVETSNKIAQWDPYNTNSSSEWFDPAFMFFIRDGFDIIIGNPPYIQLQKDGGKLRKKYEKFNYKTLAATGDIYTLFYEKGVYLLKPNGILCFITSNKWMRAGYGEKLRDFFTQYQPIELIDLGPGVFDNATVDVNILVLKNAPNTNNTYNLKAVSLSSTEDKLVNISKQMQQKSVIIEKLTKDVWFIGDNREQKLKEKIEALGKPLKEWDVNIFFGIKTGLNEAFIITTEKRDEILKNCKNEDERIRTEKIIKPILRGRDIKRYYYEWANLWLLFIPWHFPLHNENIEGASALAEEQLKIKYPVIYNHLLKYKTQLMERNKDETGIRYEWYALQRCAATYYNEFEKEKVVWQEIVQKPQFYLDDEKFYIEATSFMMLSTAPKYLCGILNSLPSYIFFKYWYSGGGLGNHGIRYKKNFLMNFPVPLKQKNNHNIISSIENLVVKITQEKKSNKNADTTNLEKEIDRLVYQLYELTDDEIWLIENKLKQ